MRIDGAAPGASLPGGLAGLKEAAQSFESLFSQMLLKSMRATVKQGSLFHGGRGEEIFGEMLDRQFAEGSAKSGGGFGIAKLLIERYQKNVETKGEAR